MTLNQVIIKKNDASYNELKKLAELLQTDDIKNNGKIIVKCNLECELSQIRKDIKEIFNCLFEQIYCKYTL